MPNFREAVGANPEWYVTEAHSGFSNFIHIDTQYGSNRVLRRIFSLARKLNYRSLMVEEISESASELFSQENRALSIRSPEFLSSRVRRLTFWRTPKGATPGRDDLLGYAIFKTDSFGSVHNSENHVYEAVMRPTRRTRENNFSYCTRDYHVHTAIGDFTVRGILYAQQNGLTYVCAHVALRTALSCFSGLQDISYSAINEFLGIDHKDRKVGDGNGLNAHELEDFTSSLGLGCLKEINEPLRDPPFHSKRDFNTDIFSSLQSGGSALLAFQIEGRPARHIVPIFGHTFNEDLWVPEAGRQYFQGNVRYYPANQWASTYLIHDDNFGPYYCLPHHYLRLDQFRAFLGISPKKIVLERAFPAELVGLAFLKNIASILESTGDDWYDRFSLFTRKGELVLRTTHVHRSSYLEHLQNLNAPDGNQAVSQVYLDWAGKELPLSFWMVEASAQELYPASRRKFGEILIKDAQELSTNPTWSLFLAARLPGRDFYQRPDPLGYIGEETISGHHTQLYRAELSESEKQRQR